MMKRVAPRRTGWVAKAWIVLSILLMASSLTAACGGEEQKVESGTEPVAEAPPSEPLEPEIIMERDAYVDFVEIFAEALPGMLEEKAANDGFPQMLEARIASAVKHALKRQEMESWERPPMDLWYESVMETFYTSRGYAPLFTTHGRLTDAARQAWTMIGELDAHAMDNSAFKYEEVSELIAESEGQSDLVVNQPGMELFEPEIEGLSAYLRVQGFDIEQADAQVVLLELLLSDDPNNPLPRVRNAYTSYRSKESVLFEVAVELEVRFADSYLRFTRDMRHGNLNRLSEAEKAVHGDEVKSKRKADVILARLLDELIAFAGVEGADAAKAHVEALWPDHDQYVLLMGELARYREIAAAGGWSEVADGTLNQGYSAPRVASLKERLSIEGYYTGVIDETYDDALADAVAAYQETHQMEVTGETNTSNSFWISLNVPVEKRIALIEANLERWRKESRVVPSDYYIYINTMDFHVEIWKDNELTLRMPIVVGSNRDKKCDARKKKWYLPNETPTLSSQMTYLVFNPYWNVPSRIFNEEYLPLIEENPNWPEENGYEFYTSKTDGSTWLRQMPGEMNALGKVKFIFPNPHNVYLHDTPKKSLFKYPERAFSHGCMRVERPMELAEYILEQEGKWDPDVIDTYFGQDQWGYEKGQKTINLDTPIDVFVEYYTVRVDDQGRVNFLADKYGHVRQMTNPNAKAEQACEPEVETESKPKPKPADGEALDMGP